LSPLSSTVDVMTTTFTPNTLAWFEVATDDPDTATSFYAGARSCRQPVRCLRAARVRLCA